MRQQKAAGFGKTKENQRALLVAGAFIISTGFCMVFKGF